MILKLGLAEPALASLRAAGIEVWIFDEVVPDPPEGGRSGCGVLGRADCGLLGAKAP